MQELDRTRPLAGRKVAILVAEGFEQVEMTEPRQALVDAGATTVLIAPAAGTVRSWAGSDWGTEFPVDATVDEVSAADYDALLIPGGVMSPDKLRMNEKAVQFVKDFFSGHKPVASICHGPWLLAEAGVLDGRTVTSYKSLRTDLENAGANWVDGQVVVDQGLVTSRHPGDITAFNDKMLEEFLEGEHQGQTA
jgi:protease I